MFTFFAWKASSRVAKHHNFGTSSVQGRRPNQEDRFTVEDQLSPGCGFFAVYDGHGGNRAAVFCADVMHQYVQNTKSYKAKDFIKALQQAFHEVELEFLSIAGREGLRDGTTAVVALLEEKALTVAHVGDSRAVLCREGSAIALTEDHKPELDPEKRRIEALGGFVSFFGCWRVMGILAMSRAIGDLFLKPYVSAEPDVCSIAIDARDEFVVLASDGIFDVFDNDQVVRIVRSSPSPQEAATRLSNSAFMAGSLDNLTAVVVALEGYNPSIGAAASPAECRGVCEEPLDRGVIASAQRRRKLLAHSHWLWDMVWVDICER